MFIQFKEISPMQNIFDDYDDDNGPDSSWILVDKKERRHKKFRERIKQMKDIESSI